MTGEFTHYIPAFTEVNGRSQLSACNKWIPADEHSAEPTCPTCKAYIEDGCRELSADDVFGAFDPLAVVGAFDPLAVVKHVPFNPTSGYKPRERSR